MNTNEIIEKLRKSLVYQMSLGSMELFHSNIWKWLIDFDHKMAKIFFPEIDINNIVSIEREERKRDITIHLNNGKIYIIENKIKSLPNLKQLDDYQENAKELFIEGLLTGIVPSIDLNGRPWKFLAYSDISERIRIEVSNMSSEIIKKNIDIILEYCEFIKDINQLFNNYLIKNHNKLSYECGNLWKIKLDDIYKKLKADQFAKYIKNNNNITNLEEIGYTLDIWTGYSNKNAIIDVRYIKKNHLCIGIQIQGNQYRIIAQRDKGNIAPEVYKEFLELGWFDQTYDSHAKDREVFGRKTSMKPPYYKSFNKYQTSWYSFVYQYFNIDDRNSYEELMSQISIDMNKAEEIICKLESI